MNILQLTQKLISIPSYVDAESNEVKLADYISAYLTKNSNLQIVKQFVDGERYNVIAYSKSCVTKSGSLAADILFIDHLDTVQPKSGWDFDQFQARVVDDKLYGLGAIDTKGNVAALLKTAEQVVEQKVMFLFYIDEEYDFAGMFKFIDEYASKLKVKQIVSADGNDLSIRTACRGLVELRAEVIGKTGHAANPANGVNAIIATQEIYAGLKRKLAKFKDKTLGIPTLNLAYLRGGLAKAEVKDEDKNLVNLAANGNNIPDYAEFVLECRTTNKIDAARLTQELQRLAKTQRVKLRIDQPRHDLEAWSSDVSELNFMRDAFTSLNLPIKYTDASKSGYVDLALAANAFDCRACCIGAIGSNSHGVNEWVDINSLSTLESLFSAIIAGLKANKSSY